jgi:hypothetical protein
MQNLAVRIGIDCGEVIAGVIGTLQPRFHAQGAVVANAQKLEGQCSPGSVLVSPRVAALALETLPCSPRRDASVLVSPRVAAVGSDDTLPDGRHTHHTNVCQPAAKFDQYAKGGEDMSSEETINISDSRGNEVHIRLPPASPSARGDALRRDVHISVTTAPSELKTDESRRDIHISVHQGVHAGHARSQGVSVHLKSAQLQGMQLPRWSDWSSDSDQCAESIDILPAPDPATLLATETATEIVEAPNAAEYARSWRHKSWRHKSAIDRDLALPALLMSLEEFTGKSLWTCANRCWFTKAFVLMFLCIFVLICMCMHAHLQKAASSRLIMP